MKSAWVVICCFAVCLAACNTIQDESILNQEIPMEFPDFFSPMQHPDDNSFSFKKMELGKRLFNEKLFSADTTISCSSCHNVEKAFATNNATEKGAFGREGVRNSPSLFNVVYQPYFLREGSLPTLEMQILVPIQEHNEFATNILEICDRLNAVEEYQEAFREVFDTLATPFTITRAIACFERTLISATSKFDLVEYYGELSYSSDEFAGKLLFESERLGCSGCHSSPMFTNYEIINTGILDSYSDVGRYRFSKDSSDLYAFKVPSLRNVAITGPYMHAGQIKTLREVIEGYANAEQKHENQDRRISGFTISEKEKKQLISFLHTLTDHNAIEKNR